MFIVFVLLLVGPVVCLAQVREWVSTSPDVGLDLTPLEQLRRDAADGAFPNIHTILIVRDGKLVLEKYLNGFDREMRQYPSSVSKSVG